MGDDDVVEKSDAVPTKLTARVSLGKRRPPEDAYLGFSVCGAWNGGFTLVGLGAVFKASRCNEGDLLVVCAKLCCYGTPDP